MTDTESYISRTLANLLVEHGIRRVVVSPGSRNAPLIVALTRCEKLDIEVVVDERSAAFIALGISLTSGLPVALVCTSGTALLNYAPAVAEAFYRKIPLIVVSADRPKEWIDQDDSQTIVQAGALANYVKRSYDLSVDRSEADRWYANRLINDAIISAASGRPAPVHINIQLDQPIGAMIRKNDAETFRKIDILDAEPSISVAMARDLGRKLASPVKVMVVAGFMPPDKTVDQALRRLAAMPNVVVLTETISNLHGSEFIDSIDSTIAVILPDDVEKYCPDTVITIGGAIVSRHVKQLLRSHRPTEHWHIGVSRTTIDCFQSLTMRIEMNPRTFLPMLASAMQPHRAYSDYADLWSVAKNKALSRRQSYAAKSPWSDFKAFSTLIPLLPRRWNVHYSNGTPIRYAQIFSNHEYHRCECNRGVSGIDGCTSTAIGASLAYNDVTLLVSGDMSAHYDIGALGCGYLSARFKMVVVRNGGGGIFRFIASTRSLDIADRFLCANQTTPFQELARAYGMVCFEATDEESLRTVFPLFRDESEAPALLVVDTDGKVSADVLNGYFKFLQNPFN